MHNLQTKAAHLQDLNRAASRKDAPPPRKEVGALYDAQSRVLEMIATGVSLSHILDTLVRLVEEQAPHTIASILLLDRDGKRLRTGAAPSLPQDFSRAVDGVFIGPSVGSCGTAAYRREMVVVTDIVHDPLWVDYRDFALSFGLRACWSTPIFSPKGDLLGTFAMYYREPRAPQPDDFTLIAAATHLAGIAIERQRVEEALRRRNEELAALHHTALGLIDRLDPTTILESLVARAATLMDTPHGYLYAVEPGTDSMVTRAGIGIFADKLGYHLQRGMDLGGRVWATGEPLAVEDYNAWSGSRPGFDELRAVAGIPLRAGSEIVGVLGIAYPNDGRTFGPDEMALLGRFGQLASLALSKAHMYDQAQKELVVRKQTEDALRVSERRYRHLFERNLAGVYRSTPDGRILDCNDALVKILGCESREDLMAHPVSYFYWDLAERDNVIAGLRQQHALANSEIRLKRKDGSPVWVLDSATLVEGGEGEPAVMEGTIIDITERKLLEDQLLHQAFHDPLTGLPNRTLFMNRLEHALARAVRTAGSVAVLFLDLDEFKVINDSLGHKVGDQLLMAASKRIELCLRGGDTVARLGGDEFTVLLDDVEAVREATEVAERIAEQLQKTFHLEGRDLFITTSIGIALSVPGQDQPGDLLRNADVAMYDAKRAGKARYSVFEPEMNSRLWERMQTESELRRALEKEEFMIHYQPVVDLNTGKVLEFEALLRWQHPTRGLVSPNEFVPVAEESGLILPIGEWVLRESCRQMREWQAQMHPYSDTPFFLSVNLSARQFRHARLVEEIVDTLRATSMDPVHLKLEITESVALDNTEATIATLRKLRKLGIRIAIDDFGTGYSALSYLKRYPVDTLKLDRSFVDGLGHDLEDTAIVHAVIAFARTLSLSVTAEGIETVEQLTQLQALGCDQGQGFYFARPMTAEAATEMLENSVWRAEQWCTLPERCA